MNATPTQTCSHCGEPRAEGQAHDSSRCYTIAHAFVADRGVNGAVPTEADHHIAELARWLQSRPANPGSPQARQARQDREISLDRWGWPRLSASLVPDTIRAKDGPSPPTGDKPWGVTLDDGRIEGTSV